VMHAGVWRSSVRATLESTREQTMRGQRSTCSTSARDVATVAMTLFVQVLASAAFERCAPSGPSRDKQDLSLAL